MAESSDLKGLGLDLHRRLTAGDDPRASAEVAEAFLLPLVRILRSLFPHVPDPHLIETAAEDAVIHYLKCPERFDPARGSLLGYLCLDATGDLKNFLHGRQKNVALHEPLAEYLLSADKAGNASANASANSLGDPEARLLAAESALVRRAFEAVTHPLDRELVELMIDGERRTEVYAEVPGVEDRPPREQAATVKRHKDRLRKLLRRALRRRAAKAKRA
jgi:RNA polymerase sigma-70 factor, ECF subfamily